MANGHLPPPVEAVNETASPSPADAALLQVVLLGYHAALFVEQVAEHAMLNSKFTRTTFKAMHNDIYEALHAAIEQLAQAEDCQTAYRQIGWLMASFFGAECREEQISHHDDLLEHLAELDASASEQTSSEVFGVLNYAFAALSEAHWLDPEPTG